MVSASIWLRWIWIALFVSALIRRKRRARGARSRALLAGDVGFAGHACDLLGRCGSFFSLVE